ncbi:hypothetical protein FSP39_021918 [Pinctada imbricata]|uniref:Fibronectin type-III domain-containing protein n=1 Tax=Pinctada imbricata TaxID=66713 RepID=A0AA88XLQ1_PINIB|nr:hypothetical protein FSP39_021918 [Pinctada imbricata]
MRELISILVLCLLFTFSNGQGRGWPADKFSNVERHLDNIQMYVRSLQDIVYQERMKYQPFAQNTTSGGAMNMAYTSFINDVESRLAKMEFATSELVKKMTTCPGDPQPPPPPNNVVVESVTVGNSSSIVVKWDRPTMGGSPVVDENLQYKVYFVPIDEFGKQTAGEVVFSICDASQTSASITDLYPRSFYKIWVGAVLCTAAESNSNPKSMKTPDVVPTAPINVRVEGTKPNAIALRWDAPAIMGVLTNYTIYVTDESGTPMVLAVDPPVNNYVLYDLVEGTRYNIMVSAFSDNGESPKSMPLEVMTDSYIPGPPLNLRVVKSNKTAVHLAWDPPTPGPGIIRGYNINYTDSRYIDFYEFKTPDSSINEAIITDLYPATTYYFRAFARTGKSVGAGSAVVMQTTKSDVPSDPRQLMINFIRYEPPQVRLTWLPPRNTYGRLNNYTLHWGVRNGAVRKETILPILLQWDSDFLDDDTTHEFKLFAANDLGFGPAAIKEFSTPKRDTIVPPNVKVDRRKGMDNTTKLHVTWDPPSQPVDGYRILYRKFEWVYSGRWQLKEIPDPLARSADIAVKEHNFSYIVVVRGYKNRNRGPGMGGGLTMTSGGIGGPSPGNMGMSPGGLGAMPGSMGSNPFQNSAGGFPANFSP